MVHRIVMAKPLKRQASQDLSGAIPKPQKYFSRPLEPTWTNTRFGYIPIRAAT
jgi:hypothetical protein